MKDLTPPGPTLTMKTRRPNTIHVFRVEPAEDGWFVHLDGSPTRHFWMKNLALSYARAQAKVTLPSVVVAATPDGKIEVHHSQVSIEAVDFPLNETTLRENEPG